MVVHELDFDLENQGLNLCNHETFLVIFDQLLSLNLTTFFDSTALL